MHNLILNVNILTRVLIKSLQVGTGLGKGPEVGSRLMRGEGPQLDAIYEGPGNRLCL